MSILSLSANTAYWQTRYENNHRTLVCYKTIQGSADGNPGGDAQRPRRDRPQRRNPSRRTRRRRAATRARPPAIPTLRREGASARTNRRTRCSGVMYIGDNDGESFKLSIPAGNANGEYASSRVWRNTGISTDAAPQRCPSRSSAGSGTRSRPRPATSRRSPRASSSVTLTNVANPEDSFSRTPGVRAPRRHRRGRPRNVSAVEYRAPSGALVFATGTMEWAFGVRHRTL